MVIRCMHISNRGDLACLVVSGVRQVGYVAVVAWLHRASETRRWICRYILVPRRSPLVGGKDQATRICPQACL
jgi:hypothetical protein